MVTYLSPEDKRALLAQQKEKHMRLLKQVASMVAVTALVSAVSTAVSVKVVKYLNKK